MFEKTKIIEKEVGDGTFFKKRDVIFAISVID